ncbi:hypothetical protein ES703_122693 [subsurface metagenome]
MSWFLEFDCVCGAGGLNSEQSLSERDWYICLECGRDIRGVAMMFDNDGDDDDEGVPYWIWEACQGR